MKTETQNLIVIILGIYAIISLFGIIVLTIFTEYDGNIILALVPVTTTPISILGGFIAGKTVTEKEEEIFMKRKSEEEAQAERIEETETPEEETFTDTESV